MSDEKEGFEFYNLDSGRSEVCMRKEKEVIEEYIDGVPRYVIEYGKALKNDYVKGYEAGYAAAKKELASQCLDAMKAALTNYPSDFIQYDGKNFYNVKAYLDEFIKSEKIETITERGYITGETFIRIWDDDCVDHPKVINIGQYIQKTSSNYNIYKACLS